MAQQNVDGFLAGAEALNRGNVERFLEEYDEDVVFEPQASQMEGAFVGPDAVKEFVTGLLDVFEFRANFSDVRDLGDRVLAIGTQTTIARGSGIEQESPLAIVATYRNGLITHFKDYGEKELALEAAGLSE